MPINTLSEKVILTISFQGPEELVESWEREANFLGLPAMPCSSQTLPGDGGSNQRQNPVARPRQFLIVLWTFPASNLMLMKTISSFQKHKPKQKLTSPYGSRMFVPFQLSNPPSYGLIVKYFPSCFLSVQEAKWEKTLGFLWAGGKVCLGAAPLQPLHRSQLREAERVGRMLRWITDSVRATFPRPELFNPDTWPEAVYSAVLRTQTQVW